MLDNVKLIISKLPKKSLQRRALLATASASYQMDYLKGYFGLDDKIIRASKKIKFLKTGKVLQPDNRHLALYNKPAVEQAVCFILNESNVQRISWGTKSVILNSRKVEFPKLIRKTHVELMLRNYLEYYSEKN